MRFGKAHGLANDFILVAAADAPQERSAWGRQLCDRHTGIGGDGVLVFEVGDGRVRMRLINSDGSDGDLSGNGLRCLAAWCVDQGWLGERHVVDTPPGPRPVEVQRLGGGAFRVRAEMGVPALASESVPMALDPPQPRVTRWPLEVAGETVSITATSMGNPHCTLLLDEVADDALVERLGPVLEHHPLFPRRTNVEFATALDRERLRIRFWERGVGPTRSSGTGSAAAAVAAILDGRVDRTVRALCDGGELEIEWAEGEPLTQTADVQVLFEGIWRPGA